MARSVYVYVVTNNNAPLACFTVKREMVAWLGTLNILPGVGVARFRDGRPGLPEWLDIGKLLA